MATVRQECVRIGTLIEGTLRGEDLLPAFADELKRLDPHHSLVKEAYEIMATWGTGDESEENEQISETVNAIQDALQEYCPPFVYFGTLEGDGACFGFWPDLMALEEERMYAKPSDADGYQYLEDCNVWVQVNDHGNVTLLENDNGKPGREIWAAV